MIILFPKRPPSRPQTVHGNQKDFDSGRLSASTDLTRISPPRNFAAENLDRPLPDLLENYAKSRRESEPNGGQVGRGFVRGFQRSGLPDL